MNIKFVINMCNGCGVVKLFLGQKIYSLVLGNKPKPRDRKVSLKEMNDSNYDSEIPFDTATYIDSAPGTYRSGY